MTDLRDKIEDVIFNKIYENFGYVCGRDAAADDILNLLRDDREKLLDAANEYMKAQYGISALGNTIDRDRILSAIGLEQ